MCGVQEDKFVCCENCTEEWESKYLVNNNYGNNKNDNPQSIS